MHYTMDNLGGAYLGNLATDADAQQLGEYLETHGYELVMGDSGYYNVYLQGHVVSCWEWGEILRSIDW